MRTSLAVIACITAFAIPAAADELGSPDRVHDFHTTDRLTPATSFSVDFGYVFLDPIDVPLTDNDIETTVLRVDVDAHWVSEMGAGAYVSLPLAYIGSSDIQVPLAGTIKGLSEFRLGNLELGGLYALKAKRADVVFRAGFALPTQADDASGASEDTVRENLAEATHPLSAAARIGDLALAWPNTGWIRLSVSPMGNVGPFFLRADLGADVPVADEDDYVDIDPILRANLAAGLDLGQGEVSVELDTVKVSTETDEDDEVWSTLALGGRFGARSAQLGVAFVVPVVIDDDALFGGVNLSALVTASGRFGE